MLDTICVAFAGLLACTALCSMVLRCRRRSQRVAVVVLGDLGRSPRMQYHCMSLSAMEGVDDVVAVAYGGSRVHAQLADHRAFRHVQLHAPHRPDNVPRWRFLLFHAPRRIVLQVCELLWALLIRAGPARAILVQNPPSIPTLVVARLAAWLMGARLVIDWHNYGYTILAMKTGQRHWSTRLARLYERMWGRLGDAHLCVTEAMRRDLKDNWGGIDAVALHDSPPPMFHRASAAERAALLARLAQSDKVFSRLAGLAKAAAVKAQAYGVANVTAADDDDHKEIRRNDADDEDVAVWPLIDAMGVPAREALIVSSTSWTEDEDFSLLLDALVLYDKEAARTSKLPRIVCAITGRGPQRAHYEALIARLELHHVRIVTLWLAPGDYPLLLGSADVGVSLHRSSSGVDLPMKVVDMFGAHLPVCAVAFEALPELVRADDNGVPFTTAPALHTALTRLLTTPAALARLRAGARAVARVRWDHRWLPIARPLFQ